MRARLALFAFFFAIPNPLAAQAHPPSDVRYLTIDLALGDAPDTVVVDAGRYLVRAVNSVPAFSYRIRVSERVIVEPPLPDFPPKNIGACRPEAAKPAYDALAEADREEQIPALLSALRRAIEADRLEATPACENLLDEYQQRIARTTVVHPDTISLKEGRIVVVSVERSVPGRDAPRAWEKRFMIPRDGGWEVSYGYGFPMFIVGGQRAPFHTTELDDGTFQIRSGTHRGAVDAIPAVFYSYVSRTESAAGFSWSRLMGGLGVDITKPTLFLGTGVTYRYNLSVSGGLAIRSEQTLLSQYAPNEIVDSNLSADQLHDTNFRARPYFAVTFRFGKNPFTASSSVATASPGDTTAASPQTNPTSEANTGTPEEANTGTPEEETGPSDPNPAPEPDEEDNPAPETEEPK